MRSTTREPVPVVFGDGLRCVGLPIVRFGATLASWGSSSHRLEHGAGPGRFEYQLWFRNAPAAHCDPASAFSTSNGLSIAWP